jgi:hypothetical protein
MVSLAARGVGEAVVVEQLPETAVVAFGLLTSLGDPVALLVVVSLGYVAADAHPALPSRRRAALTLALALGGFALTLALKHALALPRPPGAGVDGYGFPSGHALGATVVYGGVATLLGSRRAAGTAALLISLVAVSRVVIGVHYVVDVVAGVALGIGFVASARRLGGGWAPEPTVADTGRAFGLAVVVALAALGVARIGETAAVAAAAVAGWLTWRSVGDSAVAVGVSRRSVAAGGLALPVVGGVGTVVAGGTATLLSAAGLAALVVAALLALPVVAEKSS